MGHSGQNYPVLAGLNPISPHYSPQSGQSDTRPVGRPSAPAGSAPTWPTCLPLQDVRHARRGDHLPCMAVDLHHRRCSGALNRTPKPSARELPRCRPMLPWPFREHSSAQPSESRVKVRVRVGAEAPRADDREETDLAALHARATARAHFVSGERRTPIVLAALLCTAARRPVWSPPPPRQLLVPRRATVVSSPLPKASRTAPSDAAKRAAIELR
jgi:hypothetical protein